jgi:hypothetical protein
VTDAGPSSKLTPRKTILPSAPEVASARVPDAESSKAEAPAIGAHFVAPGTGSTA